VISFEAVTVRSPVGVVLIDNVSTELPGDVTSVLLGTPRSTRQAFLRLMMRLQQPDQGIVRVNDADLRRVDAAKFRRSLGWLSGPPKLFTHLTVLENVSGAARLSGLSRRESANAAADVLATVGIDDPHCMPEVLTASEQVRVGLARVFVRSPSLVVLDDPFAGVDAVERPALRELLRDLRGDAGTTVVLATGDAEDALVLGDRVVVLLDGVLVQSGTPLEILSRPSPGVEALLGSALGLRGLAFVTVSDVPTDDRAVIQVSATARQARRAAINGSSWVLVVDEERRPLGWADTERLSDGGPVTEVPLVALRGSVRANDTMQLALDRIVSSPAQMVPRLDDEGRVVGLLTQAMLSRYLPEARPL
jgi:osmoprotectant transport system ATP-binding protein